MGNCKNCLYWYAGEGGRCCVSEEGDGIVRLEITVPESFSPVMQDAASLLGASVAAVLITPLEHGCLEFKERDGWTPAKLVDNDEDSPW